MRVEAEITGLGDAVKALEKVEQNVSIRTLRAAQRFAMKPAIERAKQLVPYGSDDADGDGYHLRDSIGVRSESKKNRGGNATVMRFGAHRQTLSGDDSSGYKIAGGLTKAAQAPNYASLINDEKPFLVPAVEQTLDQVVARFGDKLLKAVSKL